MVSSGLLRHVALVRTDVSEEPGASFIRVTKIGSRRNNPEDTILHSHRRENLKSDIGRKVLTTMVVKSCVLWDITRCGGRSVGIVRSRSKGHGVCFVLFLFLVP
jgi:hypothetical protein